MQTVNSKIHYACESVDDTPNNNVINLMGGKAMMVRVLFYVYTIYGLYKQGKNFPRGNINVCNKNVYIEKEKFTISSDLKEAIRS